MLCGQEARLEPGDASRVRQGLAVARPAGKEVLDIIHAGEHLSDAAKAAFGSGEESASWLNARLAELWSGEAEELIAALEAKAAELGPRSAEGDARVAWNARDCFEAHRERIRYDVFRRHGLPLTSAHVESGIKQTNKLADKTYRELGFVLPAIAADPKVLQDFRKFLTRHKINLVQETAAAPVSPSPDETGHGLSRTAV